MSKDPERLEHALYHVLIPRLERALNLDPCPAIKLAGELTGGLMDDAVRYSEEVDP